jgi:hypothetical protein
MATQIEARGPTPHPGGVPEWLKGTDCKSVGFAYVGSNPTPSTRFQVSGFRKTAVKVRISENWHLKPDKRV